jgi:hypothetical protein
MLFAPRTVAAEARRRGVRLLLHSTHLYKNLPYILSGGALHTARELTKLYGSSAGRFLHDPRRYERFAVGLDYVNCSLSFPNCELLYHRSRRDWKCEWIHFVLRLELLNQADTLFCPVSAAADFGRHVQSGLQGFRAMFNDEVEGRTRSKLPRELPTHPQAEILVRGPLDLSAVESIIVPEAAIALEIERLCEQHGRTLHVEVLPQYFVWPKWLIKKGRTRNDE